MHEPFSDRAYRALLRVLPFDFRGDFGDEMQQVFREQRAEAAGPLAFLHLWLETAVDLLRTARHPETGQGFSAGELRDQVATMIVAGHETTALALFWSLYLLASAPDVQDRLAEEVRGLALTPAAGPAVLPRLVYARAVVSEALRLYPPAFVMVRQCVVADRWQETAIPRGSLVMIAPWILHRHRKIWRDPESFDPSRFLGDEPPVPKLAYLPFGAGPRVCVGAHFAMAEATLVLAMIVQRFRAGCSDTIVAHRRLLCLQVLPTPRPPH